MGFWVGLPKIFAPLEMKLESFTVKPIFCNKFITDRNIDINWEYIRPF